MLFLVEYIYCLMLSWYFVVTGGTEGWHNETSGVASDDKIDIMPTLVSQYLKIKHRPQICL